MIVGVDLSLTGTGIAVWRPDTNHIHLSTVDGKTTSGMPRVQAICVAVWNRLSVQRSDLVVIEGYAFASTDRGQRDLAELRGALLYGLWSWRRTVMTVPPTCLKKYATGKGNASKDAVLLAVERRYGHLAQVGDNNQADALVLVAMAAHQYGRPLATVPALNATALTGSAKQPMRWPAHQIEGSGKG